MLMSLSCVDVAHKCRGKYIKLNSVLVRVIIYVRVFVQCMLQCLTMHHAEVLLHYSGMGKRQAELLPTLGLTIMFGFASE